MSLATWLTLLSAWIVAVASPGPDFLAVMRTSATSGRRKGLFVAAGVTTGIALSVVLALTGLAVVFAQYEAAYKVVRYLGAAFLIGYGLRILWSLRRSSNNDDGETPAANAAAASAPLATRSVWKAYRIGLVTNVANPKALVFFGALLASIVPHGSPLLAQLEVFATIVGVAFAWFASLAWIASGERVANGYRRAARRIDGAVGGVFTVIGVSLAAKA